MDEALLSLIADESCPSSRLTVSLNRLQEGSTVPGVSKRHFETVHRLLESTTWTHCSEAWEEKVDYYAKANHMDACSDLVAVSYGEKDPMNVKCEREVFVNQPIHLSAVSPDAEQLLMRVARIKRKEAMPPEPRSRYSSVCIQKYRDFTRTSASVKEVATTFRLTVMWSAHCLRDAYASAPSYHIEVLMNRNMGSMLDDTAPVQDREALNKWMTANLKAKVGDVCMSQDLQLTSCAATPPQQQAGKSSTKKRKLVQQQQHGEQEPQQQQEQQAAAAEEQLECYDDHDEEYNQDDYMM